MKQYLSFIINGLLAVAVIVLFVLHFTTSSSGTKSVGGDKKNQSEAQDILPIAYIDVDTLLMHYQFAKDAYADLLAKSERSQNDFNKKMTQWQKEGAEFQRKYQSNAFLSRERAEQENNRLMKQRQELEELDAKLSQEFLEEQRRMNNQLIDTINTFLKAYNKEKKYQLILSNTAMDNNVLSADSVYNITAEVVELLNVRYIKK